MNTDDLMTQFRCASHAEAPRDLRDAGIDHRTIPLRTNCSSTSATRCRASAWPRSTTRWKHSATWAWIIKVPGNSTSTHYDANVQNHLHTRCSDSGAVRDVPDALSREVLSSIPGDVIAEIESRLGFKVEQLQVQLIGKYCESD